MQKNTAKKNTKRVAIVGATTAALLGGGIAFAAWTSTGTGSGSAKAGDALEMTVSGVAPTGLAPNGSVTMTVTVVNTNPYAVHIDKVDPINSGVTSDASGCNATAVTAVAYNDAVNTGSTTASVDSSHVLDPVGGTNASRTFPVVVSMSNASLDACKNATFTIPLTATGHSVSTN